MGNSVYLCQLKVKDYKSFLGDNEFNFAIQDKKGKFRLPQCTVFLGDNGTGKTNLLKVIANLLPERVVSLNTCFSDTHFLVLRIFIILARLLVGHFKPKYTAAILSFASMLA